MPENVSTNPSIESQHSLHSELQYMNEEYEGKPRPSAPPLLRHIMHQMLCGPRCLVGLGAKLIE